MDRTGQPIETSLRKPRGIGGARPGLLLFAAALALGGCIVVPARTAYVPSGPVYVAPTPVYIAPAPVYYYGGYGSRRHGHW